MMKIWLVFSSLSHVHVRKCEGPVYAMYLKEMRGACLFYVQTLSVGLSVASFFFFFLTVGGKMWGRGGVDSRYFRSSFKHRV